MTNNEMAEVNRRDFLKGGSLATLMTMWGGVELIRPRAAVAADVDALVPFTVKCGVIGLGQWGRDLLGVLARIKTAQVVSVCDTYPAMLRRAANLAPDAKGVEDYRQMLDDKSVQAVIVATPTPLHKDIVLAALKAGKHVYCEAPIAHSVEDARAIAKAALAAKKQVFQAGLQYRSDPQRKFLLDFIRSGALGKYVKVRGQWQRKQSWRSASPNPDREKDLNWRLDKGSSLGLTGEIGIHQIDAAAWFLGAEPTSVTGFGSLILWKDGREVPDTTETVFEFPGGIVLSYEATIANSFDSEYEIFYGTESAIMTRGSKAWLFKEVDAPLLGWEVYARKDTFYKETGIALVANATKLANLTEKATDESPLVNSPVQYALESFLANSNEITSAIEDFNSNFDASDQAALQKVLADVKLQPAASALDGYRATVMGIKGHEAVMRGTRISLEKRDFELG